MKKILPTLVLLLILFCIVFSTTAQTHSSNYSIFNKTENRFTQMGNLPTNRTAFIFMNSSSKYSNPAVAVLSTINTFTSIKNTQSNPTNSTSELNENTENIVKQGDICMYPNLTENELWVKIDSKPTASENLNIEIYNEEGERVYHSRFENNFHKINLCEYTAGTFLVKLGDTVQKVIIE